MILHPPFGIGSRLLPCLKIGDGILSLRWERTDLDGRDVYRWYADLPSGEYSAADLRTGRQGGGHQETFGALLSFLIAAADDVAHGERTGRKSDNEDLFPAPVAQWARENADELAMLACEIEDTEGLIEEEGVPDGDQG